MKKKIISILFAIIFLLFVSKSSCKAANATVVCNGEVTVNERITISVMVKGTQWDLQLKVNEEVIASNSYNQNVNKSLTFSGVYTPTTEKNLNVTLTGYVIDTNGDKTDVSSTKTITVKSNNDEQTSNSNTNTETTQGTTSSTTQNPQTSSTTNKKSSEARLSNLGITPKEYDFSGFSKDKATYDVKVPNSVSKVNVYATIPKDSKAKIVSGTGNVTLKEGVNKVEVKVVAEDGTPKTYTLNITREKVEENATTTNDILPNEPQENLEQEPEVTQKEPIGLKSLSIKNLNLNPKFDSETYEYTIELTEDISSLDIDAKSTNSNTTVEIIGNKELKIGENIITILVSDSESDEHATYQIIVNKNMSSNEVVGEVNWLQPATWGVKEKRLIGIIAIAALVIIIIVVITIRVRSNRIAYMDFPGTEELDKAIMEHQELSGEGIDFEKFEDTENFGKFEFSKNSEIENLNENVIEQKDEYINKEDIIEEVSKNLNRENVIEEVSENIKEEVKEEKVEMRIPPEYFDYDPTSTKKKGKHF